MTPHCGGERGGRLADGYGRSWPRSVFAKRGTRSQRDQSHPARAKAPGAPGARQNWIQHARGLRRHGRRQARTALIARRIMEKCRGRRDRESLVFGVIFALAILTPGTPAINMRMSFCARPLEVGTLVAGLMLVLLTACARSTGPAWNPKAAADYLDRRADQWMHWPKAARAQDTVCVSCHTALTYALVREPLGRFLKESGSAPARQRLLADVRKRVQLSPQLPPYYPDKALASRGTEAVLNALILADEDANQGHLSAATQAAFDAMWATQLTSGPDAGSWPWIQFNNEPWEAPDSGYYGATLAALAVASAPDAYRARPSIQQGLGRLHDYLTRAFAQQTLLKRADLLWAAGRLPGLIEPAARDSTLRELWAMQRSDGGWSLASLMPNWKRRDGTPQDNESDGYATGFVALVLQESGVAPTDVRLRRALYWLEKHQSIWNGRWSADSPNKKRGLRDEPRHFMDDAATGFAVLALLNARPPAIDVPHSSGAAHTASQTLRSQVTRIKD